MKTFGGFVGAALVLCLSACGGGGGSSPAPSPSTPAPSGLSYSPQPSYKVNVAIATLNPTVGGSPTSYAVNPALPTGLTLNTSTGAISGTPTAVIAAAAYHVTASNNGGSTTTDVSIAVVDINPDIGYPKSSYTFAKDVAVHDAVPTASGGAIVDWSAAPALPAGITLNATTGVISGTPTVISARRNYVITAANSGGNDTFDLSIAVEDPIVYDPGRLGNLSFSAGRMLNELDDSAELRDSQSGARLATFEDPDRDEPSFDAAIGGSKVVIKSLKGYQVYSAVDGTHGVDIANVNSSSTSWRLAPDGSYLVAIEAAAIKIFSTTTGALLIERYSSPGNSYTYEGVYAAVAELRVARGPAGQQVIESIAVPTGTTSVSPAYIGVFDSWFQDGGRFFSRFGSLLKVYSKDGVELDSMTLAATNMLGGRGGWFWSRSSNAGNYALDLYAVGGGGVPVVSYPMLASDLVFASGGTLGILGHGQQVTVVDISGATPVKTDYTAPFPGVYNYYAAESPVNWFVASDGGIWLGELSASTPQVFSAGYLGALRGSTTRIALVQGKGVLFFNAASRAIEGGIDVLPSSIELSAAGDRLAMMIGSTQDPPASRLIRVYAAPGGQLLAEWHSGDGISTPRFDAMTFSADGSTVGVVKVLGSTTTREALLLDGTVRWSDSLTQYAGSGTRPQDIPVVLSPNGTRVAVANGYRSDQSLMAIYSGTTLTGGLAGEPLVWLDGSHLLFNRIVNDPRRPSPNGHSEVVDPTGLQLNTNAGALRSPHEVQPLDANTVYLSSFENAIVDLTTGQKIWTSEFPAGGGAVAGEYVFFVYDGLVHAEPR